MCSDWNHRTYLEPPGGSDEKERELEEDEEEVIDDDRRNREASGLVRSGRLFGGLINDIKRQVLPVKRRSERRLFIRLLFSSLVELSIPRRSPIADQMRV